MKSHVIQNDSLCSKGCSKKSFYGSGLNEISPRKLATEKTCLICLWRAISFNLFNCTEDKTQLITGNLVKNAKGKSKMFILEIQQKIQF